MESAIIADLPPGNYTAIVCGVNNTTGVALVEVYDIDGGSRRVLVLYVPDDRLEQVHDLDTMGISFYPSPRDFGLAGCGLAGDVAGDALPVIRTDLGGTPVRIRHIH